MASYVHIMNREHVVPAILGTAVTLGKSADCTPEPVLSFLARGNYMERMDP